MALTGSLTDDFAATTINTTKWPSNGATVASGRARVTSTNQWPTLGSASTYTLAGSSVFCQFFPAAKGDTTATDAYSKFFVESATAGTEVVFEHDTDAGQLIMGDYVGWWEDARLVITYDPTNHRWLRLRESGGTVYWDTSADGTTWTNRRSKARPAWMVNETSRVLFQTYRSNGSYTANYMEIDNVNVAPAAAVNAGPDQTVAPWSEVTVTGSGTATWSQVSGPTVTLKGSGATRTFTAPASMTQQSIVLAYGTDQMTVTVTRAKTGVVQADGTVKAVKLRVLPPGAYLRSHVTTAIPAATATKTVTRPASVTAGDLVLLVLSFDYGAGTGIAIPTGFTEIARADKGTNQLKTVLAYKVATATEPATYGISAPASSETVAVAYAVAGWNGDTAHLAGTVAVTASSNDLYHMPALTPKTNSGLLLGAASMSDGVGSKTWSWLPPTGMTEHADLSSNGVLTLASASRPWPQSTEVAANTHVFDMTTTAAAATGHTASIIVPSVQSTAVSAPPPTASGYRRGTVLAGGEYGDKGSAYENATAVGGMSYTNIGVYGNDYIYPNQADLTYMKSRNTGAFIGKLMVRMERLTTGLGAELRTIERDRVTAVLDAAQAAGVGIVLCPWNFGAVWTDPGTGTTQRQALGGTTFTNTAFNDFWTRVMTQWGSHPALAAVELMTEPVAMPAGSNGSAGRTWEIAAQGALNAVRAVTPGMFVWVPTYSWGIDEAGTHHPNGPWITDASGLYGYAGHQYNYNRGGSQTDYTNALQSAIDQGYTAGTETDALHSREVQSARAFKTWLGSHKGFLSEYGIPQATATGVPTGDGAKWIAYGERMLKEYDAQGWWATIWTSGRVTAASLLYSVYYPSGGWDTNVNAATGVAATVEAHPSTA